MGFWSRVCLILCLIPPSFGIDLSRAASTGELKSYTLRLYQIVSPLSLRKKLLYTEIFKNGEEPRQMGDFTSMSDYVFPEFPPNLYAHVLKVHSTCKKRETTKTVTFTGPGDQSFEKAVFYHEGPKALFRLNPELLIQEEYGIQEKSLYLKKRLMVHEFKRGEIRYELFWKTSFNAETALP